MTEINTHIAYSISSTSFVQLIDHETRTQEFSVVTLSNKASAAAYVSTMNLFDCRQIVKVYHQLDDNCKVAVEKLGMKFKDWLDYEFEKWESGGKKETWWDYIEEKFTTLFGDAFIAVGEVHRMDKFCGAGLENNVAVYINGADGEEVVNCKLVNLNDCRDNEDSCALLEDTCQLSDMMSKVIYRPLQDSINALLGHVPMAVTRLLNNLKSKDFVRLPSDAAWILDEPLFWQQEQKKSFIIKLWHLILISHNRDVFSNAKMNAFLSTSISGWRFDIEVGTTLDRIKLRMMENLRIYQEEEKGMPVDYTLLDGFTGATGMYRQSLYHNEDKPVSKIWGAEVELKVADLTRRMERSGDISSQVDRMIGKTGCLCSCLHAALLDHKNNVVGSDKIQMIATLKELSSDYEV